MKKPFTHPLARRATIARAHRKDGSEVDALLIVTTLELDPKAHGYKADKVERLHAAAREYLAHTPEIGSYAVLARPKDWDV
jgi:hypothetical protein